jgi:cytochrome P450
MDGADHARLRRLVAAAFTARRVEAQSNRVRAVANQLIDGFPRTGRVDLVPAYAEPLPVAVIGTLLGVPDDLGTELRDHTRNFYAPGRYGPPDLAATMDGIVALLTALIRAKRDHPSDDLVSAMVAARDGDDDGDRLTEDELLSLAFLILFAGYENSVHVISAAIARALADPDTARLLRAQPSPHTDAMSAFTEHVLRIDQPMVTALRRFAVEDVEVGGHTIRAGDVVYPSLAAANADPDADGPHLTFGHGPHYCLGAALARLEIRTAVWTLLHRLPDLALALALPADRLIWRSDHRQRALTALPVTYT